MYVISRGVCAVLVPDVDNAQRLRRVRQLSRNDYFGEMTMLDSSLEAQEYIIADEEVTLSALHKDDFTALKELYPDLVIEMHRTVGKRLQEDAIRGATCPSLEL